MIAYGAVALVVVVVVAALVVAFVALLCCFYVCDLCHLSHTTEIPPHS